MTGFGALMMTAATFAQALAADATHKVKVEMTAAQEVPPHDSKAKGEADFVIDPATKQINWSISTSDLSGPAVAAHIHGPAEPGANAGVVVNLAPNGMANPLMGSATLTDTQLAEVMAGKTYVNVHTAKNPMGEIRGQIKP
jgi:hypothetical protein